MSHATAESRAAYARDYRAGIRRGVSHAGPGTPHRPFGNDNAFKGDAIGYTGAHYRARQALAGRRCLHCGSTQNVQAALTAGAATHTDAKDRDYSASPHDYLPLCASCHKRYDSWIGPR